jgi:aspartate racemase
MKTIGLIGGMSWESSAHYYRIINERVRVLAGGLHSARVLMLSVDFAEIERMQTEGRWADAAAELAGAARALEHGGADCVVLCTNTMHKVADEIAAAVRIPFLHIADATAAPIASAGLRRIGLLGTRFTMEEEFYRRRLASRSGAEVIVPGPADRAIVNRIIYEELVLGVVLDESRAEYLRIIDDLIAAGAEGIVLGCTEIMMLVGSCEVGVPMFDTTTLHADAAVDFALGRAISTPQVQASAQTRGPIPPADPAIEYLAELPTPDEFERLFRASGWSEALEIPGDRLAASLPHAWYSICARLRGQIVGMGLVLSDAVLHALIVDVIVTPEMRDHGVGTAIMKRLIARCEEAGVLQVQLFSARGKREFYERFGFAARPQDGPGMELRKLD